MVFHEVEGATNMTLSAHFKRLKTNLNRIAINYVTQTKQI